MTLEKINKINDFMMGILKVLYLNFLWLIFSILGLGILGVGPATYALMKYFDQWLRLKNEPPITHSFYLYFKERFWQSVIIGFISGGSLAMVTINFFYVKNYYIRLVNMVFIFLILIGFTHIFKVMVAMNFKKIYELVRSSFLLGYGYLLQTVVAWAIVISVYLLAAKFVPILIVIFGVGFAGLVISGAGNLIIKNLFKEAPDQGQELSK